MKKNLKSQNKKTKKDMPPVVDLPRPTFTIRGGGRNIIEQTAIAKFLGISMKSLHRILSSSGLDNDSHFQLINNKRHYDLDEVLTAIKKGNGNV